MSLYFLVIIGTILGPFFLSFDKKIHFYTKWKFTFLSIFLVATFFIVWDEFFTQWGIWGFTPEHLQGWYLGSLPLEEICFFLFVPYAFLFVNEVLEGYFPKIQLKFLSQLFSVVIPSFGLLLSVLYFENSYTFWACLLSSVLTILFVFVGKVQWYANFTFSFLVIQIPFFLVNSILTGLFTDQPIVWYNNNEIVPIRIGTIPLEDFFYNYCLLLLVFFFYQLFKFKKNTE